MTKVTTRTATIYLDKNKILHIEMIDGIWLDYEDAIDNALVIKRLTGKKVLKLIDARANFGIDKRARVFINQIDKKQTIARAVIKGSSFGKLLLMFFTSLSKPATPTKIFTDYDEAYSWLQSFKKDSA